MSNRGPVASAEASISRLRASSGNESRDERPLLRQPRELQCMVDDIGGRARASDPAEDGGQPYVLVNTERVERNDLLECPGDAEPTKLVRGRVLNPATAELDPASFGMERQAGDCIEQGGLAGTVRPGDPKDGAFENFEADIIDRQEAAEALAKVAYTQYRVHSSS